jgi:hypothetical protein
MARKYLPGLKKKWQHENPFRLRSELQEQFSSLINASAQVFMLPHGGIDHIIRLEKALVHVLSVSRELFEVGV